LPRTLARHPRAVLLCAYAALVFALMNATPLWLDEVLQLGVSWRRSFWDLLPWIKINPGAVPLPYFIQQISLKIFGYSAVAARIPTVLFSVLGAAAFIALTDRIAPSEWGKARRTLALALFLLVPLQFRYALEARGYSQGLFFAVASMVVFLELERAPTLRRAMLYFATLAVGLYFHPFLVFAAAAQVLSAPKNRHAWIAAALAGVCFVPWVILQHQARQSYVNPALYPIGHVTPVVVLHELTGGGYVSTLCLLILAGFGLLRGKMPHGGMSALAHRLLVFSAIASIAGPLIGDLAFQYFFAGRQFLLAMPALALLAAHGFGILWERSRLLAIAPALAFFAIAAVKDYQNATVPKDDLAASADAVAVRLAPDACVITAPSWSRDYYSFFRPGVDFPACAEPARSQEVIAVIRPGDALPPLPAAYTRVSTAKAGRSEVNVYKRASGN
jgi:uncharacterized membrane protein